MFISIEEFYKTNIVSEDFDENFYQNQYPDTRDYYQPYCIDNNIDDKHRLFYHYVLHGKDQKRSKNRLIAIKVQNGLANRLRTLNSFFSLSQNKHAILKVCWGAGSGWSDESFLDLFLPINGIQFISSSEFNFLRASFIKLDEKITKNNFGYYDYFAPKEKILSWINKDCFTYDGDSCLEYMLEEFSSSNNKLYDVLIPKPRLLKIIDSFPLHDCIGVHIRRGDSLYHPNQDLYQLSDDKSFVNQINEEIKLNPEIKFFLATDCLKTQQYFNSLYPDKILYNKNKRFNDIKNYLDPKPYQDDAVVDLFSLSKTQKIIGNNYSSFSSMASELNNIPLIIAKNEKEYIRCRTTDTILVKYVKDWQYPAFTEKAAYINHTNKKQNIYDENLYVAFPWASFIDHVNQYNNCDFDSVEYLSEKMINFFDPEFIKKYESHTVCQHIFWKKLLPLWNYIGIKNAHVSHLTTEKIESNIKLHPWHLIASNMENPNLNKGLLFKQIKNKKYLCSFLGAYNKCYRSDIRIKIQKIIEHSPKCFYSLGDSWFLNKIVYDHQIRNKPYDLKEIENGSQKYNNILSDSIFSLCPDGTGPNTIRLWESMSIGSIPVLFENNWARPTIPDMDWKDISITIRNNELDSIIEILESVPLDEIEYMQINCINAYNKIRLKTCF
jgi:hypothetical protein